MKTKKNPTLQESEDAELPSRKRTRTAQGGSLLSRAAGTVKWLLRPASQLPGAADPTSALLDVAKPPSAEGSPGLHTPTVSSRGNESRNASILGTPSEADVFPDNAPNSSLNLHSKLEPHADLPLASSDTLLATPALWRTASTTPGTTYATALGAHSALPSSVSPRASQPSPQPLRLTGYPSPAPPHSHASWVQDPLFEGRQQDVATCLGTFLTENSPRIGCLFGTAGVGKSAVACAVASWYPQLLSSSGAPAAVLRVDLHGARSRADLRAALQASLQAVGTERASHSGETSPKLTEGLVASFLTLAAAGDLGVGGEGLGSPSSGGHLGVVAQRRVLLVLDNAEGVLDHGRQAVWAACTKLLEEVRVDARHNRPPAMGQTLSSLHLCQMTGNTPGATCVSMLARSQAWLRALSAQYMSLLHARSLWDCPSRDVPSGLQMCGLSPVYLSACLPACLPVGLPCPLYPCRCSQLHMRTICSKVLPGWLVSACLHATPLSTHTVVLIRALCEHVFTATHCMNCAYQS